MKKILFAIFAITAVVSSAQEKETCYYFTWAYSYKLEKMIVSDVKSITCKKKANGGGCQSRTTALGNQWFDYLKAEYRNDYFEYKKEEAFRKSEKEAVAYRREIMGRWEYPIYKIYDFRFYCN